MDYRIGIGDIILYVDANNVTSPAIVVSLYEKNVVDIRGLGLPPNDQVVQAVEYSETDAPNTWHFKSDL